MMILSKFKLNLFKRLWKIVVANVLLIILDRNESHLWLLIVYLLDSNIKKFKCYSLGWGIENSQLHHCLEVFQCIIIIAIDILLWSKLGGKSKSLPSGVYSPRPWTLVCNNRDDDAKNPQRSITLDPLALGT